MSGDREDRQDANPRHHHRRRETVGAGTIALGNRPSGAV